MSENGTCGGHSAGTVLWVGAHKLKSAYGEFCSRHRDAVDIYKRYLHDQWFSEFMRHCQAYLLLKKKGIPECLLFVTQCLTKYPLLIEPLINYTVSSGFLIRCANVSISPLPLEY